MTATSAANSAPVPRGPIRVLPDGLINKIAAGEVVERPASVVKELLENALDAGATRLAITIEDGGRTLIRITDNGSGIPPEEAPLAFAQHATSKIASVDDLFAIHTMGFRGEALASIAGVSHTTLITRTPELPQAVKIEVRDSVIGPAVPCAAPVGTTLEVRDLFYSVPARRKFLRADATEFGHIHEMVLRIALPNPHVAVMLTHNGRSVLELPATADARARVAECLGRELLEHLLPIDFDERGLRVSGFVGTPETARATAKFQYLFLNGRYIRDRSIFHAIKEAFRGLIEPNAQPVAAVFLQMDPMTFDINVHPQKTEVRFRDPNVAYRSVLAAVREKLLSTDLTPQVRVPGGRPAISGPMGTEVAGASSSEETRRVLADFFRQAAPVQPNLHFGVEAPKTTPTDSPSPWPARQAVDSSPRGDHRHNAPHPPGLPPARVVDDLAIVQQVAREQGEAKPAETVGEAAVSRSLTERPRFVQLHNAYLVAETGDGLVIIDQHALHERIMYEELFTRVTRGPLEGQRLLLPEVMPITPKQQAVLDTLRPLLADLGIEVEPFDAQTIAVHSFPSLLAKVNPREFLQALLDQLLEAGNKLTREELLHEVLDMASCKAAVKAGYPLSDDEIAALLAQKETVDRSSNCPHGRPTTLKLTLHELEKQFKRK